MYKKLFATNNGLKLGNINHPEISQHDVLIEVISSFFSPGTEEQVFQIFKSLNCKKRLNSGVRLQICYCRVT